MAENEYLDIDKSHRWLPICHAFCDQESVDRITMLFADCLRKAMNATRKRAFNGSGPQVPLSDLLDAWEQGPGAVARVVRECRGYDYVRVFADATLGATSRKQALEQFMLSISEKISDQIVHKVACPDGQRTFARIQSVMDQAREGMKPQIRRWADQLAFDPGSQLRRAKGADAPVADVRSVLSQSLLGIRQ
jgi:hypothetical protein